MAASKKKAKKGASSSSKAGKLPPKRAAKKAPTKKLTKRQAAKKAAEEKTGANGATDIQSWLEKVQKLPKFKGTVQISRASDVSVPYRLRRNTGVFRVDRALGGGFHAGGNSQVYGGESSGKTFLAYLAAGNVQRNYGDAAAILVVNTEVRPDKTFARRAGFRVAYSQDEIDHFSNLRKDRGQEPFTKEQLHDLTYQPGTVLVASGSTGEKALEAAYETLKLGLFQLVIIESLGALLPQDQEDGEVGDRTYGGSSVMLTQFMNKVYPLFMLDRGDGSMLETTILGINQVREIMSYTGRGKTTKPAAGARAWRHAQLVSLELSKSAGIRAVANGPFIGHEVKWEITKGKAGTHDGKKGSYSYFHVPKDDPAFWSDVELNSTQWGIDQITDLVEGAAEVGAIEVSGSWYKWEEGGQLIVRAQGKDAFAEHIVNDPELEAMLWDCSMRRANLPVRYK